MKSQILVYGWYNHGNAGDEFFKEAFGLLFPDSELVFVDRITKDDLESTDLLVFGGGSFMYKEPRVDPDATGLLDKIRVAYIGVGIENEIHPFHLKMLQKASIVAVRSPEAVETLKKVSINSILIPDIVYLVHAFTASSPSKKILIIPNVETIPVWNAPSWATLAWERFKNEFAQFLDERVEKGWKISFLSMCKNSKMDDLWAATEIVSKMSRRSSNFELVQGSNMKIEKMLECISNNSVVLSQRYHGLILSEMVNVPSIAIHHHDKLKNVFPFRGEKVPYYEFSKRPLHEVVDRVCSRSMTNKQIDFLVLKDRITLLMQEVADGQVRWNSKQ